MIRTPTPDYLAWLLRDNGIIELCHIDRGLDVGWFADVDLALQWARDRHRSGNLFTTVARIDPYQLDEYRQRQGVEKPGRTIRTPDEAIQRWTRLFFDFDPERPKDTASTADELAEANERMKACRRILEGHGWAPPAIAMSGNGWHLHYRAPLPNTTEFSEALSTLYAELHHRLSDDAVQFDRSVRNPARLCALYGAQKRKGTPTADRPHRHSWISIPSDWRQVHPRQVMALAEQWRKLADARAQEARQAPRSIEGIPKPRPNGKGAYGSLDVVSWFKAHDHYQGHRKTSIHAVLCPWHDEHTTSPTTGAIVYEADGGWPGFRCHHSHCADRDIRDVLALWPDADQFCTEQFQPRRAA